MFYQNMLGSLLKIENIYKRLFELASLKKEAILNNKYEEIVKLNSDEEKCAIALEEAEKQRQAILNSFLSEMKLPSGYGLSRLIEGGHFAEKTAEAKALKESLINGMKKTKELNDENISLINSSKAIIEATLEFIRTKINEGASGSANSLNTYSNVQKGYQKPKPNNNTVNPALLNFIV